LHDTTTNRVSDNARFVGHINTGKRGFFAHVSLLVDAQKSRCPLGVGALEILARPKKQDRSKKNGRELTGAETSKLKHRESERWWNAIEKVEAGLPGVEVIHVIDREGDSYELLSKLIQNRHSFVIRWCKDRNARPAGSESDEWQRVSALLESAKTVNVSREVNVSERKAKTAPGAREANPPRLERQAHLRLAHCTLELKAPRYLPHLPQSLKVNVVRVFEPNPPQNEEPIEWVLLTNLPTNKNSLIERVVDIYRQRWLIEEFFKVLKTGCAYRTRKLTNPASILNCFAMLLPIAWKALALRCAAADDSQPAAAVLDQDEIDVLKAKAHLKGKPLPHRPTAADVLLIVAQLGGHRKARGAPGTAVLMRGIEKLQLLAAGWRLRGLQDVITP
jgi:IS4 transposase